MTLEELRKAAAEIGVDLTDAMIGQFGTYAEQLKEWNEKMNLTAITELPEITEKHFYDCLIPLSRKEIRGSVCDVGSGAGFPGIVWKIARPDLDMTLVEPTGKRCTFLNEMIRVLGLENIRVVNERAEEFVQNNREKFDTVTARAVANMNVLAELTVPLVKTGGYLAAMKGARGKEEAKEAENALRKLGCEPAEVVPASLPSGDERINLYCRKVKATPAVYPRNYAQIKKKPLR